mmetsp:Transcript_43703/g.100885  ORF Transcript_43703/g.100885 Transcript_43703/m.100885 type:complete len:1011 (+) Transcript_43703:57-3089(+)
MAPVPDIMHSTPEDVEDWVTEVDDISAKIKGIIDGSITDFDNFDREMELKDRAKSIREAEAKEKRERYYRMGIEGKGEGKNYKWWCRRCFVEYSIDLPENRCSRCDQSDKMITRDQRREELLEKVEDMKQEKVRHQWRKDKWLRWKKSQALLRRSRNINYKAWEYWEPDTDSEDEGEPIVPRENPEFVAMEADLISRRKKTAERAKTAKKCQERGNALMKEGDFIGAIEQYEEGLENNRSNKALWTNKALAEIKVFRWQEAVESCNKVIEYAEIFEEGFKKSADACFKAFTRRAVALSALHKWEEALKDAEDAVQLFPRDKEAKQLHKKTLAAVEEAREASKLCNEDQHVVDKTAVVQCESPEEAAGVTASNASADSQEEEGTVQVPGLTYAGSMAALTQQAFDSLTATLRESHADKVAFCSHRDANEGIVTRDDALAGRKVCLKKVTEVSEPSRLDAVLKDIERCCILWRKGLAKKSGVNEVDFDSKEDEENERFVEVATPRALEVLLILAKSSDLHCEFTSPAIRHVWPFIAEKKYRYQTLELLCEWSQRTFSAKALAEFAGRYPEPHLLMLVDALSEDKENMLPPDLESRARQAQASLKGGKLDLDAALVQVMDGMSTPSATELAVTIIGNTCLAGTSSKLFKEQMVPVSGRIVDCMQRILKPQHPRLCGRAAGALCNIVRLGASFAEQVQETCMEALVTAVREEPACAFQNKAVLKELSMFQQEGCMAQLLGALVNLLAVRPVAAKEALTCGLLELVVPLISQVGTTEAEVPTRALLLVGRLVASDTSSLSPKSEALLLQSLSRIVEYRLKAKIREGDDLTSLDAGVRILTLVLTKAPGCLARLVREVPRIGDVTEVPASGDIPQAPSFDTMVDNLMRLACMVQPKDHVSPEDEGGLLSKVRGNLALLFAGLSEAQAKDDAPQALAQVNFTGVIEVFVECLRKERGGTRHNAGVCVTRLAQQPRYRQRVRDLNGIESLHQIQMPQVEKQKSEAMKKHRIAYTAGHA